MSIWNMLEKHWNICVSLKFQPSEGSSLAVRGFEEGDGGSVSESPALSLSVWGPGPAGSGLPDGLPVLSTEGTTPTRDTAKAGKLARAGSSLWVRPRRRWDSGLLPSGSWGPAAQCLPYCSSCYLISHTPANRHPDGFLAGALH